MGIVRSTVIFVRETIAYILIGMLIVSVSYNYKLIQRARIKTIDVMPYSLDIDENTDSFIRDARKKANPVKEYKVEEY